MRILVTDGMDKTALETLRAKGHEVVEQFYAPEELGEAIRDFDVVVVRSATKVRANHIDAAKGSRLKLIIRGGVGVDNIDVAYAGHTMREGKWEKKAYGKGVELGGKTLGVIGYGRIGQALGRMAQGLGMNVVAYDIYHVEGIECETMHYVTMDELLAQSDFISLHTPAIDGKPLINRENIAKMKDGVIFVNTSRGNNVDEEALLEGLNSGKIRGAGLDVYAEEPAKNEALLNHPNVSCTPHIGAATKEAQKRIGMEIVSIIDNL